MYNVDLLALYIACLFELDSFCCRDRHDLIEAPTDVPKGAHLRSFRTEEGIPVHVVVHPAHTVHADISLQPSGFFGSASQRLGASKTASRRVAAAAATAAVEPLSVHKVRHLLC